MFASAAGQPLGLTTNPNFTKYKKEEKSMSQIFAGLDH
jgi:hypothetical protein